jgi:2-oxoglutarate ferredoxin oxidoreductase subunit gamma
MRIRIIGRGGQGVVLASVILGRAAAMYDGKHVVQTQSSRSAAARGGLVRADIVIQDRPVIDITFEEPDILVLLSESPFKYEKCKVMADSSLNIQNAISKPFMSTAYKLGDLRVANMVVLGFLAKLGIVSLDGLKKCIDDVMPEKIRQINKKAVDKGFQLPC